MKTTDEALARAFDMGAAAHERGESAAGAEDLVPYCVDAWLAGWWASHFYGLQRAGSTEVDDGEG